MVAEIFGPDLLIVLALVALLFGGARLPKLARSLGSAKSEFEMGLREGRTSTSPEPGPEQEQQEKVTLTRAELDALIKAREATARPDVEPTLE
jgi:sec-independent protein translocase protein TatA